MTTSISPVRAGLTIVKFLFLFSPSVICVDVRLIGSTVPGAGRLEVYYRGEWGTVCDDSWDDGDAWTVCRSLGWSDGKAFGSATFGRGGGRIWLDDVQCSFFNTDLEQCSHSGWGSHNCNHGEDAGVWCVRDGDVILTGKTSTPHSGRVEVYHSGEFGTVCDDHFDNKDADVICKMLGYTSGGVAHGNAKYGQGAGRIWLDDLTCSESATRLDQCGLLNWGTHNCGHGEDAGVFCYRGFWETAPCSVTCGIGTQLRFLTCQGFGCVPKSETATCFLMACSVDGQWGSWSSWTSCTVTCGSGTRARSRQCNNPAPAHNGLSCPGDGHESEECTAGITCPVDGQWAHWNGWTSCSVSCEDGTRTRSRRCDNPAPVHNGRFCPGDEQESEGCTAGIMCPIDGAWGLWTSWVSCSASCGYGSRTRSRQCNNPAPAHNGHSCIGDGQESEECTAGIICPIDGQWGLWTEWTVCSVSCENGTRTRSRQCNNPAPAHNGRLCPGDKQTSEDCTVGITCPIDGQWGSWNTWTSCSVSCENGIRIRYRQCNNPAPAHNGLSCWGDNSNEEECSSGIMCPIDGQWTAWNSWSPCSVSCEDGTRTRSRQCLDPAPAHGGLYCPGDQHDTERCSSGIMCPVDGQWGSWLSWTSCSVSCENGTRTRSRQCNNPAPAYNGHYCSGDDHDYEGCTAEIMCPIDGQWSEWNGWSLCSVTCEHGSRTRSRQCNNPAPAHNGLSCLGVVNDEEKCSAGIMCPIDGQWGKWNSWSSCSVTCECGEKMRSRDCDNPNPAHGGMECTGNMSETASCGIDILCPGGCGKDHLMCTDKKTCIHVSMSCDSVKQCPDGSDEINCIGRNLLYMPQFQYLFSSDSTRMCPCLPWLIITWLSLAVFQ
ncbi:scavenger receptor cysteine-rich type 1 protein M130-like isoform X2 [Ylistrum balloti]|uniref:scavenger receptor cysteine-rich type 1 protein M130-like isoform X2 n=1 Tax=Ylistrum balloti TaxID=509963 RepID=UPI002905C49B|nr:scavenger receptor cysteine-rich type 1 protein M130-like isoform X2 [Ylistrum balloti]